MIATFHGSVEAITAVAVAPTVNDLTPKICIKNIGTLAVSETRTAFATEEPLAFPPELVHPVPPCIRTLRHGVVTTGAEAPETRFSPAYVVATLAAEFTPVLYNPAEDAPDNAAALTEFWTILRMTYA
jgi:hypothetical protein